MIFQEKIIWTDTEKKRLIDYGYKKGVATFIENTSNLRYNWQCNVQMKKIYRIKYEKYRKFKMQYMYNKTLFLSSSFAQCDNNNDKIFKEEEYNKT